MKFRELQNLVAKLEKKCGPESNIDFWLNAEAMQRVKNTTEPFVSLDFEKIEELKMHRVMRGIVEYSLPIKLYEADQAKENWT